MPEINKLIHQPVRLRVMATLAALEADAELDFTFLRDRLDLTDGNLGSHLEKLNSARFIRMRKTFVARKPRTFIKLTQAGRRAFEDHVQALKSIISSE